MIKILQFFGIITNICYLETILKECEISGDLQKILETWQHWLYVIMYERWSVRMNELLDWSWSPLMEYCCAISFCIILSNSEEGSGSSLIRDGSPNGFADLEVFSLGSLRDHNGATLRKRGCIRGWPRQRLERCICGGKWHTRYRGSTQNVKRCSIVGIKTFDIYFNNRAL